MPSTTAGSFHGDSALYAPCGLAYDPGATVPKICVPGYGRAHRHVTYAEEDRVCTRDGLPRGSRPGYVSDATRKDRLEDQLHVDVYSARTTLAAARATILKAWSR